MHWPPTSDKRVDQHGCDSFSMPHLEHREQPDRPGADDRHVGVDVACHAPCVISRAQRLSATPPLGQIADMSAAAATRLIDLPDLAATEALAASVAALARPGDAILLEGALGAGKTAFARAFLRAACGDPALEVPSPTFTLVQSYDTRIGTVHHFDLWRLDGPGGSGGTGLGRGARRHRAGGMAGPAGRAAPDRRIDRGAASDRRRQPAGGAVAAGRTGSDASHEPRGG